MWCTRLLLVLTDLIKANRLVKSFEYYNFSNIEFKVLLIRLLAIALLMIGKFRFLKLWVYKLKFKIELVLLNICWRNH